MTRLVLFDVDLTLVNTDGAGTRALAATFAQLFGTDNALDGLAIAGRTDFVIVRDALARHGLLTARYEEMLPRVKMTYLLQLRGTLAASERGRALPGAHQILARLQDQPATHLGLATGNFRDAAFMKLRHYGLAGFFHDGGFGDEVELRESLVRQGVRALTTRHGLTVAPDAVWVIGDTPHDIESARANGARSIAVATGSFTVEALREHEPTHVVADLAEALQVLDDGSTR